jgi:hypothetical protein
MRDEEKTNFILRRVNMPNTTDSNQDGTQPGKNPNADGTQPGGNTSNAGKTYTQAEYDSAMGELRRKQEKRFARQVEEAKQAAIQDFLREKNIDEEALSKLTSGDDLAKAERRAQQQEKLANEWKTKAEQTEQLHRRYRVKNELLKACAQHKVLDPEIVLPHLEGRIAVEDDEFVVLDDKGQPTQKTISELTKDFLATRPYLVSPTVIPGGAGSRSAGGISISDKKDLLNPDVRKANLAAHWR